MIGNIAQLDAQVKGMSKDQVLQSMVNGSVPQWMGIARLQEIQRLVGAAAKPDQSTVLDDLTNKGISAMMPKEQGGLNPPGGVMPEANPPQPPQGSNELMPQPQGDGNQPPIGMASGGMVDEDTVWNGYQYVPRSQISPDDPRFSHTPPGSTAGGFDWENFTRQDPDDTRIGRFFKGIIGGDYNPWSDEKMSDPENQGYPERLWGWLTERPYGGEDPKSRGPKDRPRLPPSRTAPPVPVQPDEPRNPPMGMSFNPALPPQAPKSLADIYREQLKQQNVDKLQLDLPSAPNFDEDFAKAAQQAQMAREENKWLALLAAGGAMAGASGGFGQGLAAATNAGIPVYAQGMADYRAVMNDLRKDKMSAANNAAEIQSRNANTMIQQQYANNQMQNAAEDRAYRMTELEAKEREAAAMQEYRRMLIESKRQSGTRTGALKPSDQARILADADKAAREELGVLFPDISKDLPLTAEQYMRYQQLLEKWKRILEEERSLGVSPGLPDQSDENTDIIDGY